MTYEVYRTDHTQITVDVKGREVTFPYNPDTNYALMPASVYGSEPDVVKALQNSDIVDGIFNHNAISEI